MIKILNSSLETLAILQNVVSPIILEELNRGFTFSFSTVIDGDKSSHVNYQNKISVENNYFNIAYTEDERTLDGIFIHAQCEHVSYDLLSANFTAGFTATGLFSAVATTLLAGTGFTVGTVQITASQTISVNESTNARQILNQLAVLYGGELQFSKYQVNLLTRRGADRGVQFRYRKNIAGVKRITDNRTKIAGLPTISYQISPAELEFEQGYITDGVSSFEHFELGDTVRVIDADLGIDTSLRIVKESHNTEQRMQGTVEISNFVQDVSDTITQIQTTSVTKDDVFNGCSIGPDLGFVATRSDGKARAIMNATDGIKIQKGNTATGTWTDAIYLDTSGNGTFSGFVLASQIIGGSIVIGTGNNTFKADSNGIYLGNATFGSAPFRITMSGALTATSATINGQFTSKSTAGNTLMNVYQDTYGGIIQVYDNSGNLNVKVGVESGTASNTAGTIILYNDSITKPRVALGIDAAQDAGVINLSDTAGNVRASMKAYDGSGTPAFFLVDGTGSIVTYLTLTTGFINSQQIATQAWCNANFVHL